MNAISREKKPVRLSTQKMKPNLDLFQKNFDEHGRELILRVVCRSFNEKFDLSLAFLGDTLNGTGEITCPIGSVSIRVDPQPSQDETENLMLKVVATIITQCCMFEDLRPFTDGDIVIISDDGPDECPCSDCCGTVVA